MELFKRFRGHEPSVEALLKRSGVNWFVDSLISWLADLLIRRFVAESWSQYRPNPMIIRGIELNSSFFSLFFMILP
jgi:hypothetical protein